MKFIFKARTQAGELKDGEIEASNKEKAIEILQKNKLFLLNIEEKKKQDNIWKGDITKYFNRVTPKELVIFYRQLATLIGARVPILSSLTAIREQTDNDYFQAIIQEMINDIEDGSALSAAMEKHKKIFSVLAVGIIRAGEASGGLKNSIQHIADNTEKNFSLTSQIKSALIYPVIVLIVFIVVGFLVMTFIVPKLLTMVKELDVEIPWYTQAIILISGFMASYWWAILLIIAGAIIASIYYLRTEEGAYEWDRIKIKIPKFGAVIKGIYMARFSENLSVLLSSGIPIIKALTVVGAVIGNQIYEKIILEAAEEVRTGGSVSTALKRYPEFPPIVTQMIKIGEESGKTDEILKEVAKFYEQETEATTKNLTTLIEPIMIVVMGLAVGLLAVSVIMPIYDVAGRIQ